jgi:hypothetical protein
MGNRAADFADIWGLGTGFGLGGNVRATQYVQFGAMGNYEIARALGRRAWSPVGYTVEVGLAPIYWFRSVEESRAMILARTLLDANVDANWTRWYDPNLWTFTPGVERYQRNFDRRLFDFGFSAYLGLGIDFDFNPVELVDFILGIFTIDFPGDDTAAGPEATG